MTREIIKIYYDLETTGTEPHRHSIHQISGIVEVNGEMKEKFNFKTRPHPKAKIEPEALKIAGVTEEQIMAYPDMREVYRQFVKVLTKYIDKFDVKDKAYLVGFNNRAFDDKFLVKWFEQNDDRFFFSWFFSNSIDVSVLATEHFIYQRPDFPSFKLKRVAQEIGMFVDKDRLHDAEYDVWLTREIYLTLKGQESLF